MKTLFLLLPVPFAAALALPRQDPKEDPAAPQAPPIEATVVMLSEVQYIDLQGKTTVVAARNVVEVRLFEDDKAAVRLELLYDNGDYSLVDAQAVHVLRNGPSTREVRLMRCKTGQMRFPRLP